MMASTSSRLVGPAACWLTAAAAALAPAAMTSPIAVAAVWTLLLAIAADLARRLAHLVLPGGPPSIRLLAGGLLFEAIAATCVAVPGLCGWFRLPVIAAVLGGAHLAAARTSRAPSAGVPTPAGAPRQFSPVAAFAALLLVAGFALTLLNLIRYTVQDADSMWYHLPMAGEYVRTGSLAPIEAVPLIGRAYPGFRQSIVAFLSLASGNEHLACVGALEYALLAGAVYAVARAYGATRPLALCGALCAVTTPVVTGALSTHGNDLTVAVHLLLSVLFLSRFLAAGGSGDAVLAGTALGALAATKFSGPGYAVAVVVALAIQHGLAAVRGRRQFFALLGPALLLAGPWFGRNLAVFGNPLYPARLQVAGHRLFDGPLGSDYFAPSTMGWDVRPQLEHLHQFAEAHGLIVVLGAMGPLLVALGAWLGGRSVRRHLGLVLLPPLLLVAFLHHPFNLPGFDAAYTQRYLIAWFSLTIAAAIAGLALASRGRTLAALTAVAVLAGTCWSMRGATRLALPMFAAAGVATGLLGVPPLRRTLLALPSRWRTVRGLRAAVLGAALAAAVPAVFALQALRARSQYDPDYGYHDAVSDRGWGPACAWVHRNVAGKRVGLHGSIYFFPLLGEPFGNEVFVADDLHLPGPRKTVAEVAAWVDANRLDYLVCCVPRLERTASREFVFGEAIGPQLLAAQPQHFVEVFASRGTQVLQVRRD